MTDGILSYVDVVPGRTTDLGRRLYDSVFLPEFGADELSPPWFDEPDGVFTIAAVDAEASPSAAFPRRSTTAGFSSSVTSRCDRSGGGTGSPRRSSTWHVTDGGAHTRARVPRPTRAGESRLSSSRWRTRATSMVRARGDASPSSHRVGARVLAIDGRLFPYTQPKLASSAVTRHVQHMLLGVLPLSTEREQEPDPTLIVEWLREYYAQEEGTSSLTDGNEPPGIDMLLDAERVETVPFGEFANLPQVGEH